MSITSVFFWSMQALREHRSPWPEATSFEDGDLVVEGRSMLTPVATSGRRICVKFARDGIAIGPRLSLVSALEQQPPMVRRRDGSFVQIEPLRAR